MMESDAFSSFVTVDMELQKPLFEVGLIAGTQYADLDDEAATPARRFRHSLEVLKRAVQVWNRCGESLAFVAHLGDALAAENAKAEAQWAALHTFDEERSRCTCKQWHLVPGEHDLRCFGASQLGAALQPCRPLSDHGEKAYYSFLPAQGWRVLVLDAYDVSLLANAPDSDAHAAALGLVQRQNPNPPDAPDTLAGLEGTARRWGYDGGGIGAAQLTWLGEQLSVAEAASERVLVLCHKACLPGAVRPQGLLFNHEEAQAAIGAHPGVVAAWISAAEPLGSYARDGQGVHHLSPCAAVHCDVNQDAFGVVQVFADSLKLRMSGKPPDAKLRPQGWPDEMRLPQGGKLVSATDGAGEAWALGATFARLWLFFMWTLMTPISPLLRLLSSGAPEEGRDVPPAAPDAPLAVPPSAPPSAPAAPPAAAAAAAPKEGGVEDQV